MSKKQKSGSGSRQPELFARSLRPTIPIEPNHRLLLLTDRVDWTELLEFVENIRLSKVKNAAGRPPHLRVLTGAMLLKATRDMTWREAEDLMRHYAPARYLCGLTETEWTPDHTTLHDFAVLLGEDGVRLINEYTVRWAVSEKLANPSVVVGDTTAQEAAIPYPNEMGLMAAFVTSVVAASKRAGQVFRVFAKKGAEKFRVAREKLREYRLFSRWNSKAWKNRKVASMASTIEDINRQLGRALKVASRAASRVTKSGIVARRRLAQHQQTMAKLVPQIQFWLRTGFVATKKIISLHVPELYSIVRGKVGKKVEFGLTWGFTRLCGGFLLARLASNRTELLDSKFAVTAVDDHISLFGKPPRAYAYDRGGYSAKNVASIKKLGVKEVGLAPRGRCQWAVSAKVKEELVHERALVEAGIGAVKSSRYNFHRPRAKSTRMMGASGQLGVLGFNLNKLARAFAARRGLEVAG